MEQVRQTIKSIPLFAESPDLRIEPAGGRTSRNFVVRSEGRYYFVRLDTEAQHVHGIDRRSEFAAIEQLAAEGLGPEAIYFCPNTQTIVTDFLNAPVWTLEEIRKPDALERFGKTLATMHQMPGNGRSYDMIGVLRGYVEMLGNTDLLDADAHVLCQDVCDQTSAVMEKRAQGFCHNDLWYGNFLNAEDGIKFVDLELAGMNDVYVDLASFIHFHDLSPNQTEIFLSAYTPEILSAEKLGLTRRTVLLREYLWALTQRSLGSQDEYYVDYSTECLNALQADPSF